jgi:hypothetical protein
MNASVKKVPVKGELICIDLPGEDFKIQGPGCFIRAVHFSSCAVKQFHAAWASQPNVCRVA